MKKQLSIARTLSLDFLLNIAATLISTGTMQLLLYPQLAANLGEVSYGTMLTIMGAVNVIVLAFGNNLAQVRLVNEHDYENKEENGDFQIFLLVSCFLSSICILAVCFLMNIPKAEIAPIIILVITTVLKSYYLVAFRLSIDYRRNLVANIIMALGYILAAVFLLSIFHWSWAFTIANILCIIYICCSSKIIFDPLKITSLFRQSLKSYAMLIIGGLLSNLTTYLDRFIIYPLLGAASVSSFFVATYFSKSISLVFSPITSVLLSYFTQGRIKLTVNNYLLINLIVSVCSVVLVFVCVTFGAWLTGLLFPSLYIEATPYIFLGSVGTVISIACGFNNIVILVTASPVWQTLIPVIYTPLYLILAIVLSSQFGLEGMCAALILAGAIRFLMIFIIGLFSLLKSGSNLKWQL